MNKALLLAPLALVALGGPALAADSGEEFFKGKTLKLIVGVEAGQRDDTWARMFLKPMAKYIPGNPTIIVQNMQGARNIVANYLENVAPKDGTVFGHVSGNLPVQLVTDNMKDPLDVRKFNWLGSVETTDYICFAMANAPVKTADDLFTTEMITAAGFAGSAPVIIPALINNGLGGKMKVIRGYGGQETYLSLERGETQGTCTALGSFNDAKPTWLKEGKVRILIHTSPEPIAALPDVPSVFKYTKTDEQKQLATFVTAGARIGRPFATAQGVPPERVAILRKALQEALKDPELLAEAQKRKLEIHYQSAEDISALVNSVYTTPKPTVEKAAEMLKGDK
jgi:tripartite-type tricarboxylate transporter receptor subunit TctC